MLFELWEQDGLNQRELAERLQITPAAMTKMIRRMKKVGFVVCQPEVQNHPAILPGFTPQGRVVFENVTFKYDSGESDPAEKDISFTAEPGHPVAVIGTTGAGKSSLVHLIPRLYDVTSGRVTINGQDIRDLNLA